MSDYRCEHGKMAMGRYCDECEAERKAKAVATSKLQTVQTRKALASIKEALRGSINLMACQVLANDYQRKAYQDALDAFHLLNDAGA